jgi:hypothetical protein
MVLTTLAIIGFVLRKTAADGKGQIQNNLFAPDVEASSMSSPWYVKGSLITGLLNQESLK